LSFFFSFDVFFEGGATGGAPRLGRGRRSSAPSEGVSIDNEVGETGDGSGREKVLEWLAVDVMVGGKCRWMGYTKVR